MKMTKCGNTLTPLMGPPAVELVSNDFDTPLGITADGHTLMISPVCDPKRRGAFEQALVETNGGYARMLKRSWE